MEERALAATVSCAATEGHRGPIHREVLERARRWHLPLRGLWESAVRRRNEIRVWYRLAELFPAHPGRANCDRGRPQLADASHRGTLRAVWRPSGPPIRRR